MTITTRLVSGQYIEASVEVAGSTYDLGLLNRNEALQLVADLTDAAKDIATLLQRTSK
jgi:hypothetical protein